MKKLMFATALVASAAAFAAPINAISFEGYSADATVGNTADTPDTSGGDNGMYFYFDGEGDGSLVKAFGSGDVAAPSITRPLFFASAAQGNNYLELSTEGGILWRSINTLNSDTSGETPVYSLGNAEPIAATGTYLDTLVQFTPTEDGGAPEVDGADKLAIWLNVDSSGASPVTNLMVKAGFVDDNGTDTTQTPTTYTLTTAAPVVAGQWYRLTIKAIADVTQQKAKNALAYQSGYTGFEIYLDGVLLAATAPAFGQGFIDLATDAGEFGWLDQTADASLITYLRSGTVFPALGLPTTTATLQGIGFKGSGALDDIVWTTEDPFDVPAAGFTLTWPAGVTPVSYTIDGGTPVSISSESSPFSIPGGVVPGSTVAFTFTNADGATKTMSVEASSSVTDIDASTATYVWADYLGDAVNGAYTIDDANDLDMLRKGVAANLATLGETFKQTANIDMSQAGPFAGIGTYAANANAGLPFQGTYDGQGFKISDIDFTQRNYGGVFNQVKGGAIKNLTVENITCSTFASDVNSGEWGCAIVGNAGLGTTLQNLTAMGSFGTAAIPCRHNVAGIAIRLSGGASNVVDGVEVLETLVKDCTNNATLYGSYTKAAGITALTQDQNGVPNDYVLFDGCVNNANIAMVAGKGTEGRDGLGGILGYVADGTKMQNCVNNGTLTSVLANAKIGGIVGWAQGRTLDDLGGNKNPAAAKMIGDPAGSTITGFQYATVDNGVATTITGAPVAGGAYLLERDVAASETPVATLTAVGDTISFDTALGYTFAGTVASSGAAGIPVASTSGTVTTYTAGYFPRTATAGQDGSAANPFEIADEDDLQALQAAVANDVGRNLAYVQVADIALTAAWEGIGMKGGKDHVSEAAYDAEAFTGVYDGGNYTISNFLMENGTDYGALFNSIYNATIKNLKLSWGSSTLCANSSASGGDTGASFVGVAKASTLQNLTTVAGTVTTVSASKDFGGIVGYLMAGSTVDSCTNALNVASLINTGRKCGGIAIITQGGTGTAVIRNCKNSGTVTAANKGGILGYVGVATEIDGCENTAALQLFHFQSGSITASGVNKGNATVASNDKSGGVSGLYFATVDGDVATFVADNALALNGEYKVMSAGATATFAFAEAGTIAFDTALFTPTWAVTAAEGLTLTDATEGTVKTYTAAGGSGGYKVVIENSDVAITPQAGDLEALAEAGVDTNSVAAVNAALAQTIEGTSIPAWQALFLGVAPTTNGLETVAIKSISFNADGDVEVVMADGVELKTGRGVDIKLKLMGSTDLTNWTQIGSDITNTKTIPAVTPEQGETKKFYKVVVDFAASSN